MFGPSVCLCTASCSDATQNLSTQSIDAGTSVSMVDMISSWVKSPSFLRVSPISCTIPSLLTLIILSIWAREMMMRSNWRTTWRYLGRWLTVKDQASTLRISWNASRTFQSLVCSKETTQRSSLSRLSLKRLRTTRRIWTTHQGLLVNLKLIRKWDKRCSSISLRPRFWLERMSLDSFLTWLQAVLIWILRRDQPLMVSFTHLSLQWISMSLQMQCASLRTWSFIVHLRAV